MSINLSLSKSANKGQSTVEYIILVGVVIGAVMLFVGPAGKIMASAIKSQKDKTEAEYTDGEKNAYSEYYEKVKVVPQ